MNGNSIGAIIVVIIVIVGGWFLLKGNTTQTPPVVDSPVVTTTSTTTVTVTPLSEVSISYTDTGFSPSSVTVPLGTKVNFVNESSGNMWVASAAHPTHTAYSGTSLSQHCPDTANESFDECAKDAPGTTFSFTFNKEGTWKYHDHIDATKFGTVVVTAASASSTPQLQ